ncbi:MAG TPA: transglutaminase-like cysteine peptidase [Hyphomicrobiaceae bacterium]|nr:transglutaminase-like cysteine peptidase [Hyphomicrobiaceae bacterium]
MRRSAIVVACLAGMLASPALAEPARTSLPMRIFGPAQAPYGFVNFCERWPRECMPGPQEEQRFDATPDRRAQLDSVNRTINHEIKPVTDIELYGVADYWTIPTRRGDCEDYVLLKRKRLMELGWPASALLITVVRDERGDGHAVLTARTQQGDFILDNKTDDIKLWQEVPYQFVMRQSYLNPRVWLSLDPKQRNLSMPLAGVRSAP